MPREKLLIVELWGIGDLILSTPFLRRIIGRYDIVLLGKRHARATLGPTYRAIQFIEWDGPWTKFRGKYRFWRWDWGAFFALIRKLRSLRPDVAVSVRKDPRDHLLMWMVGAKRRVGFPTYGSGLLLTDPLSWSINRPCHVVDDWLSLSKRLTPNGESAEDTVWLQCENYVGSRVRNISPVAGRSVVCLHVGARIAVRRWPESYFAQLIEKLRSRFDFSLLLIPDPDGYGRRLANLADQVSDNLTVEELIATIGSSDLLISNDSAPAHIAAACETPVIAIFGPTDPGRFRPWGEHQHVVIRDICPYRPCFDYCRFPEPFCLTKLAPEDVWPEIEERISQWINTGVLPKTLLPNHPPTALSR
jgi:ADP-heptose:LPS heptosyltransferase